MKLRLFALRKENETHHIEGKYFSDLKLARMARDTKSEATGEQYAVTWGPDHKKFKEPVQA